MKTLIIDVGNSRISCGVHEGIRHRPTLEHGGTCLKPPVPLIDVGSWSHPVTPDEKVAFTALMEHVYRDAGEGPVVLVSVVPEINDLIPPAMHPFLVDHSCDLPFGHEISEPDRVGADRWCNVAAASAAGLRSALVVDAGTATTFDLLLNGVFVGGMIAPGMAFAAQKLGESAARLDPVPFGPAPWTVGRDSKAAMAAGAWHTGTGGIRYVVAGLIDKYGDIPVVVTGGLVGYFGDTGWYHDPHWTLRGAAFLSER